jgi:Tfp pilus assembly protein PilX
MRGFDPKREGGSALFVSMMLLVLLGLVGFAALETVTRDQQVAGFQNHKRVAFYAAEAGLVAAVQSLETTGAAAFPQTNLGDTATYPYGRPSYQLDTSGGPAIEDLGTTSAASGGMNMAIGGNGVPVQKVHYWRVKVQGQAASGTTSRVEALVGVIE